METLKKGSMAYLDTFAGLVPCKVISVFKQTDIITKTVAKIELTDTIGAYKKGEILIESASHVIPRKAIKKKEFSSVIMPYHYELDTRE